MVASFLVVRPSRLGVLGNWLRRILSNEDLVERLSTRKMGTSFVIEARQSPDSACASIEAAGS